jgi:site-specific DNA recombinase
MNVRTLPRHNAPLRAALYGRASSDPKRRGRSIKDQFAVGEMECLDRGWSIVDYYEDRDRSASRRATKVREDFERLISDIEAGLIDVVVYAEKSRTSRNMETSLKLRNLCERAGVLLCYDGRVYDMRVPSDRKEFTRDALQSEEEAESIIARAERTARLNAQRGGPHAVVPFGYVRRYDPDDGHLIGQFPHPRHADVVRDLFARAAARESINTLTAALRTHVPTAENTSLRHLLRNKAYIGVRTHRGQDMANCQWEPIVEPGVFSDVQEILKDSSRRSTRDHRVRHLLSGIASCARCLEAGLGVDEAGLRVTTRNGSLRYRCGNPAGHAMARQDAVDAWVEAALFEWLSSGEAVAAFRPHHDAAEVDRLRGRVGNMKAQLESARELAGRVDENGLPMLSIESLAASERLLLPQIAEDEKKLRVLTATADPLLSRLVGASIDEIGTCWNDELEIPQRRHLLRQTVNVELRPAAVKGAQRLTADRVGLIFAGEAGFAPRPRLQRGPGATA